MVRLIRCIINECGVSRTGTVYDDPATDFISQSFENANAEISKYTFGIILEFALNRKRQDHGTLSLRFALSGLPITKVGVNFDSATHNITDWVVE